MAALVHGEVRSTLVRMAVPMLAGTFAMNAYNLTDAWFVARLGTEPLAAMAFTFPVVILLTFMAGGIGTGITTLVAHALGRRDHDDAARLTTHGLTFAIALTVILAMIGACTIDPLFTWLGADARTLPLVRDYMRIWYLGALTMSLPMIGNGLLISAGDSRSASRLMLAGTGLNALLNPIFIFGWLGIPAMGIAGSALATVIAQAVSASWLLTLLHRRHHLLTWRHRSLGEHAESARRIMVFAIPSVLSMSLMPISAGAITWIAGGFGTATVAACGAAGRIEVFAFVIPMALGMSLTPFVSQNHGAGRLDRIKEAKLLAMRFALLYGLVVAAVFVVAAPWLAAAFSDDPAVAAIITSYLRIIPFGFGMMEVHRYCGFFLTGLHRPITSTMLNALRVGLFLLPLSFLGAHVLGVNGLFFGRLATDLAIGAFGLWWLGRLFARSGVPLGEGLSAEGR